METTTLTRTGAVALSAMLAALISIGPAAADEAEAGAVDSKQAGYSD